MVIGQACGQAFGVVADRQGARPPITRTGPCSLTGPATGLDQGIAQQAHEVAQVAAGVQGRELLAVLQQARDMTAQVLLLLFAEARVLFQGWCRLSDGAGKASASCYRPLPTSM